jgi:hypothetical protein
MAYLSEEAENFLSSRFDKNPEVAVPFEETFAMLRILVDRHHLPCDSAMIQSAVRAAHERCGWTESHDSA